MSDLIISVDKGIQKIVFNRPKKKNAITRDMYEKISSTLDSAANDDNILMTVLTGEGDFYSSGNDFGGSFSSNVDDPFNFFSTASKVLEKFVSSLIDYPKILVAIVNGPAIGIAVTTLGLCDLVFASDKAYFFTPFVKLGITAEGCSSVTFSRILGPRKAAEMLYFNHKMDAKEAKEYNFVNAVLPHSKLSTVWNILNEYALLPRGSLLSIKELVRGIDRSVLHAANSAECKALDKRWQSEEFLESLQRFFMKTSKL